MKKFFIIMILFFVSITKIKVLGNEVTIEEIKSNGILEKGGDAISNFLYDGVDFVGSNINENKEGRERIFYKDPKTNEPYIKNVLVTKDVTENISMVNDKASFHFPDNFDYQNDRLLYHQLFEGEVDSYFVISYYKGGIGFTVIYYYADSNYKSGEIKKYNGACKAGLINDNELVLLVGDNSNNVKMTKIIKGNEVQSIYFSGNKNEKPIGIVEDEGYYYVAINTNSSSGYISRSTENKVVSITKVKSKSMQILETKLIGNNYDNYGINFKKGIDKEGKAIFFLYMDVDGSKGDYYHNTNSSYKGTVVLRFDNNVNFINLISIPESIKSASKIYLSKTDLCLSIKENDSIAIYYYPENSTEYTRYSVKPNGLLKSHVLTIVNDAIYIAVNTDKHMEFFWIEDGKINKTKADDKKLTIEAIGLQEHKNNITIIAKTSSLYALDLKVYYTKPVQKKGEGYEINLSTFYCNSENIGTSTIEESVDISMFGKGFTKTKLVSEKLSVFYKSEIEVLLRTNVIEDDTYDLNLELCFNGIARLNGVDIKPGHTINKVGTYLLEIIGVDNQKKSISFAIKDYSFKMTNHKNPDIKSNSQDQIKKDKITSPKEVIYHKTESQYKEGSSDIIIGIAVIFSILSSIAIVTIKIGR